MAAVVNKTTLEFLPAVNTPDYPSSLWLINPDMSAVANEPQKYWKLDIPNNAVLLQTLAEQAATDAALAAAAAAIPSTPNFGDTWFNQSDGVQYQYNTSGKWKAVTKSIIIFSRAGDIADGNLAVGNVVNGASGFYVAKDATIEAVCANISAGSQTKGFSLFADDVDILDFNLSSGGYVQSGLEIDVNAGAILSITVDGDENIVTNPIVNVEFAWRTTG